MALVYNCSHELKGAKGGLGILLSAFVTDRSGVGCMLNKLVARLAK